VRIASRLWIISPIALILCAVFLLFVNSAVNLKSNDRNIDDFEVRRPGGDAELSTDRRFEVELRRCTARYERLTTELLSRVDGSSNWIAVLGLAVAFLTMIPSWIEIVRKSRKI